MAENKEREWDPRNTVEDCALRPREEKNLEKKIIGDWGQDHHQVLGGDWEATGFDSVVKLSGSEEDRWTPWKVILNEGQ